jgi:predicted acylesterase/phospholipase RssA
MIFIRKASPQVLLLLVLVAVSGFSLRADDTPDYENTQPDNPSDSTDPAVDVQPLSPEQQLAQAPAAALEEDKPPGPITLSITGSGGVSLGAYQAGYLYYLSEVAKLNTELLSLRVVTGASAGMINMLLVLSSMGQPAGLKPEDSLLYKVWTELRYDELLDVKKAPAKALSSRTVLERLADQVEEEWNKGFSEDVDIVIGATATRLKPRELKVSKNFSVQRQEERFVFRIQGRGVGREPMVSNYVDRAFGLPTPLLPFVNPDVTPKPGGRTNFSVIRQILFASSAIPIVFLPQQIDYCLTEPDDASPDTLYAMRACPKPTHSDVFYDGSLADRRPLGLAFRIAQSGLVSDENSALTWRDMPDIRSGQLPDDIFFLDLDPRRASYPSKAPESSEDLSGDDTSRIFATAGIMVRGLLNSAQSKELATLLDEHPQLKERMMALTHDFPTMSGQLLNFFGFFDREFRKFDFYLGMRDARHQIEHKMSATLKSRFEDYDYKIHYPEDRLGKPQSDAWHGSWRPYFCLRSIADEQPELAQACDSYELQDFRILMQTTFDRLYEHCRNLEYDETLDHLHCRKAMAGNAPPKIWQIDSDNDAWKRRISDDESHYSHSMRLLEDYEFHFKDLGLDRDDASLAPSRIREILLSYLDEYAKKLGRGEKTAIRILGKPAVNFFKYAPPEGIIYLLAGTGSEIALSATLGQAYWLRFNFALQVLGLGTLLTEAKNVIAFTPLVGLEAEIFPLSNALLQTKLGLRVGYQFSSSDQFMADVCNTNLFDNDSTACSAPVAQVFLAVTFYERIRLQAGIEWFPRWLPPTDGLGHDVWNGLLQVGWQWISPF